MFFLLPVGVDYRARRYPVVTFTLMGLCVIIYLVTLGFKLNNGDSTEAWVMSNLWLTPSLSHWWTYITSLFVHAGFFHLLGNMVYLFLFGSCVEDVIGRPRFIVFYLVCGLASEFMHVGVAAEHFASDIPLGGASGAISGCIGAFLVLFLKTRIEFKWVIFFFFRLWSGEFFLPAWLVISFWFLSDLAGMALSVVAESRGDGVAFGAHVGGTLCGLALMGLDRAIKRAEPIEEAEDEEEEQPSAAPIPVRATRPRIRVQLNSARPALVEAPTIFLFVAEQQTGPFNATQVQRMFLEGAIPADALYWQEGMTDWRGAEELRPPGSFAPDSTIPGTG
jgi:membrane associated rhomboid family serine protease